MGIVENILPQLEHEMKNTRITLSRVPDDKFSWKPHSKSMSFGRLATHLAEIPGWLAATVNMSVLDLAPAGGPAYKPPELAGIEEVLKLFDENVAAGREALAGASDEVMLESWTLAMTGNPIFTMPRVAVVRAFVISHTIHHRAQLGLYLRLNDIPVPATYGPSGDEF